MLEYENRILSKKQLLKEEKKITSRKFLVEYNSTLKEELEVAQKAIENLIAWREDLPVVRILLWLECKKKNLYFKI